MAQSYSDRGASAMGGVILLPLILLVFYVISRSEKLDKLKDEGVALLGKRDKRFRTGYKGNKVPTPDEISRGNMLISRADSEMKRRIILVVLLYIVFFIIPLLIVFVGMKN